jgi:segregation and condensation protein A
MDVGTADPDETQDGAGQGPLLTLDGFTGPLDRLLILARARQVDLARLSLTALGDQLAVALQGAPPVTPLGQKGAWVVMVAWLVQLRSLLLLPVDAPARQAAEVEADQLRARLLNLRAMQALAGWLQQRPQLGRDVFARGRPERIGVAFPDTPSLDVIAFLWASLALFDDDPGPDTANLYRPQPFAPYAVAEARERILRRLAEMPDGGPLDRFLPDSPKMSDSICRQALRRRSGWASTFVASLELARHGDVVLGQGADFQPIHVRPASSSRCDSGSDQDSHPC